MTVYKNDNRYEPSNVVVEDGLVKAYDRNSRHEEMKYIDYGFEIMRKSVLQLIPGTPCDLDIVYKILATRKKLATYSITRRFYEIGSFRGLSEFTKFAKRNGLCS